MMSYAESGRISTDWTGEIPKGWVLLSARRLFQNIRDNALPEDDQLSVTQSHGVVPQRLFMEEQGQNVVLALAGTGNFKRVLMNDFVISLRSFQGGIEHSAYEGCVSPAYTVLRPRKDLSPKFFTYLLKDRGFVLKLQSVTSGIRDGRNISYDQFAEIPLPHPPLCEQRAIAVFLDQETAKIDALVGEQRRLIALLKEKRQAVISRAVTRGLNPTAPLKPSGIDWLGDIPAHWEVTQAKRFVSVINGFAFPSTGFETEPDAIRLLRGINVGVGEVRWESKNTVRWTRQLGDKLDGWELRVGDLVLGMDRPWISAGVRVAVIGDEDVPSLLLQRVAALRTRTGLLPEFLYRQLQSEAFVHHFLPETTGVSVPHISPTQIACFMITVPPEGEQQGIVEFIEKQTSKFEALESEATQAIALLQERRSALISAVVTGKIDVCRFHADRTEAA